ncbi:MAG: serpin family protein [Bacteroides sp.]|jgi:serpin B|nr:serpin family protein [Bacteroides sp.]
MKKIGKYIFFFVLGASLLFFSSCNKKNKSLVTTTSGRNMEEVMELPLPQRNNLFAFDLLKAIPEYKENFIISPFSISSALAMTYAGADGKTKDEMMATLYFDPEQERFHPEYSNYMLRLRELAGDKVQLNIANNLWAQQGYHFRPQYFDLLERNYGTTLNEVDFYRGDREQIRLDINQWVYDETREKISDLILPGILTEDSRLVLVNAVHFFGPWAVEFDKNMTRQDYFTNINGERQLTEFMFRTDKLPYFASDQMEAIELSYDGGDFSMLIFLPKQGISLPELEANLTADDFIAAIAGMEEKDVHVIVPKFKAETKTDLEDLLAMMGMPLAFSNKADFSGMTGEMDLKIDKVIHKAMIEVAEEGTEAAAATAVVIIRKTAIAPDEEQNITFKADRPFLYFIKDNRFNSILFMGRQLKF